MDTITVENALDLIDAGPVAIQDVSNHRWYTRQLVVIENAGRLEGFYYLDPASELQEDQDRFESDPVSVFPVVAHEVAKTVYEPV